MERSSVVQEFKEGGTARGGQLDQTEGISNKTLRDSRLLELLNSSNSLNSFFDVLNCRVSII